MKAWAGAFVVCGYFPLAAAKSGVSNIGLILDVDAPTEETITAGSWRSVVSTLVSPHLRHCSCALAPPLRSRLTLLRACPSNTQANFQRDQVDLTVLALRQGAALGSAAFSLPSRFVDAFADESGLDPSFAGYDAAATLTSGSALFVTAPLVGTTDEATMFLFHFSGSASGSAPAATGDLGNEGTWGGAMVYEGGVVVGPGSSPLAAGGYTGLTVGTQRIYFDDASLAIPVTTDWTWE
jgi:hypothetical protein